MRLVVLESPYAGKTPHEIARNVRYLRACMHDCFQRGDIPFPSHGLYTQPGVLRDEDPEERKLGIMGGLLWGSKADAAVVYKDLGITSGMHFGMVRHKKEGRPVEERELGPDWDKDCDLIHVVQENRVGDAVETHKVRPCPNLDCCEPHKVGLSDPGGFDYVWCESCGTRGPVKDGHMEDAVALWNDLPRQI
jgi:hypothetical protein